MFDVHRTSIRPPVVRDDRDRPAATSGRILGRGQPRTLVLVAWAMLLLALVPADASAQSDAERRRERERMVQENEDLKARIAQLEAELAATRAELEALRVALEQARDATGGDETAADADRPAEDPSSETEGAGDAPSGPVVTVDERRPNASPRAIRAALRGQYDDAFADRAIGVDGLSPVRLDYLREVRRWVRRVEGQWSMAVEWIVEPVGVEDRDRSHVQITLQAVDPISGAKLGDPFLARISQAKLRRLERTVERMPAPPSRLVLNGNVLPSIRVDESRPEPGPFDDPPWLAPFVTFEFGIDVRSLEPAPEPKVDADAPTRTAADDG